MTGFPTEYENIVIDLSHPTIERLLTVLNEVTPPKLEGFVEHELQNLVNVLTNSLEPGRPAPAQYRGQTNDESPEAAMLPEESWLDA